MKRKKSAEDEKIVPEAILTQARREAGVIAAVKTEKCNVCGSEVAPTSTEQLCWVCRRLKISAWRDSDLQAASPE
jgi:methionyl-tRNA synthetase